MQPDWQALLGIDTAASAQERRTDVWDNEYSCSYSADGTRLLDAENFPEVVRVREGTQVICDEVFAFQDYMDEERRLGEEIPPEERISFLERIFLPSSLTHIGVMAFRECGWMRGIRLPKSLQVIGEAAFAGCWELRSVACPASLRVIGDDAFAECFSLERVRLNRGLKALGAGAFHYCESLEEIVMPCDLDFLGGGVFEGAHALKRIYVRKELREKYKSLLPESLHRKLRNL